MKSLTTLAIGLLAGASVLMPSAVVAQHEHSFQFNVVGNEPLFGGATVRDTATLVDEGFNYTLRGIPH